MMIRDFYPRISLTTDYDVNVDYKGISIFNVFDWLLSYEFPINITQSYLI